MLYLIKLPNGTIYSYHEPEDAIIKMRYLVYVGTAFEFKVEGSR